MALAIAPAFLLANGVSAAPAPAAHESVLVAQSAWIRTTPGSDVAAAYLTLRNPTAHPVTVTGVQSPIAGNAMIHETTAQGGVSRMRAHERVTLAPGEVVKLEPGGLHVMLHGLTQPLVAGQSVVLVLLLADGGRVQVLATVRPLSADTSD